MVEEKGNKIDAIVEKYGVGIGTLFFSFIFLLMVMNAWVMNEDNYLKIGSSYVHIDSNLIRNQDFVTELADTISDYDIFIIQGVDNVNESIDKIDGLPSCDRNKNANESSEYKLVENTLESALPEKYKVLISQQTGSERFAVIFNKNVSMALAQGVILPNASQVSQYCAVDAPDASMKISPFLVPFRANNYTFAIMTANVDSENTVEEMNFLQYDYGYIAEFYKWNFGDVFLFGNNIKVTDEMRFSDERYYVDDGFITLTKIANQSDFKYKVDDGISTFKIKIKEE